MYPSKSSCSLFLIWMLQLASKAVAVNQEQVVYGLSQIVGHWSKSIISYLECTSDVECAVKCSKTNCIHYSFDQENNTCSLFSGDDSLATDLYKPMVLSKERCSSDKKEWLSVDEDGWQVFVRRLDGSVNFNRSWADYRAGFGDPCGEFWLGLETIHNLTSSGPYKLRVEMTAWDDSEYFSEYSSFTIGPEASSYTLLVAGYQDSSTAGDSLIAAPVQFRHHGMTFSTYDHNNGPGTYGICAVLVGGGWWYNDCLYGNPTGGYYQGGILDGTGIIWQTVYGNWYSFKRMVFKIQP